MLLFWMIFIIEAPILGLFIPSGELRCDESVYWLLICFNSLLVIACSGEAEKYGKNFGAYFIGAYVLRLFFLIWTNYFSHIFLMPNAGIDEYTFYYQAMSYLVRGDIQFGYSQLYGYMSNLFGLSMLYGKFVNILFSMSSLLIFLKIMELMEFDRKIKKMLFALACFFPNYALLSALLLRESLIVMLLAISLYYMVMWWKKDESKDFLLSLAFALAASVLHSGCIVYAVGISIFLIAAKKNGSDRSLKILTPQYFMISVITIGGALILLASINSVFLSTFGDVSSIDDIASASDIRIDGDSGYDANIVANGGLGGMIINSPFHALYYLGAPFPWQWRGLSDIVAFFISSIFYFYVFVKSIQVVRTTKDTSYLCGFLLIAILAAVVFGWGVSNSGTALRHRDKFVFHYLLMYGLIVSHKNMKTPKKSYEIQYNHPDLQC